MNWISVKDRLPLESKDYLVVCTTVTVRPIIASWIANQEGWYDTTQPDDIYPLGGEVTHWAELPPLPMRKDEE